MRFLFLLPLFAVTLLTALPARAKEGDLPALDAEDRAILTLLHPREPGSRLKEAEVTPGRFLVGLQTLALPRRRTAVLLLTSGLAPEEEHYQDQTYEAELAVVSGGGTSFTKLARERVPVPFGVGSCEGTVSTVVTGKKGEVVIQVKLGRYSDGEGSVETLTFFQFDAGAGEEDEDEDGDGDLERILEARYTPSSGSGYPHEREDATLDEHPSLHEGYSDLSLTVRGHHCRTEDDCRDELRVERVCWVGTRYASLDDCLVSSATASSHLKSGKAASLTYGPDNVRDGEDSTAWCEGAKGTGRGEWLAFDFRTPVTARALTLVAGYNKSPETWRNNARLKRVRLHFSDGTRQDANLRDTASPQALLLEAKGTLESVKLEVLAVYPGRRHEDACVSEVDFSDVRAAPVQE